MFSMKVGDKVPGPNSAPNGDGRLVRGSRHEDFVWCEPCNAAQRRREEEVRPFPRRDHDRLHGRLRTGKTELGS